MRSVAVIFGDHIPVRYLLRNSFSTIVADKKFKEEIEAQNFIFIDVDSLVGPGSVHEAAALLEDLPRLTFNNGLRVCKSFVYEGYELWWIHYNSLFYNFCMPYFRYIKLLEYLKTFKKIYVYKPAYKSLFTFYFKAYGCNFTIVNKTGFKKIFSFPIGLVLQSLITLLSLPLLVVLRRKVSVFIGDKFEKKRDYDFRMGFIYAELRQRGIPFVEFVRSLESWKTVIKNFFIRRRPVVYSEGVAYIGRCLSTIFGGRSVSRYKLYESLITGKEPEEKFRLYIATHHLILAYDDVWAIRMMKFIVHITGIKVAFFTAALERNFHTVLGCKLNAVSTLGILHGVSSRYATPYDYMNGFDGEQRLSLDLYGVWSDWWKEKYIKESDTYRSEHLHVSGPMRPLVLEKELGQPSHSENKIPRVLFIAEQTAAFNEVMPYLNRLLVEKGIELTIKFRPFHDGFETWLFDNYPDLLVKNNVRVVKGNMQDAIKNADVVIGCHSTGVLEALLQLKIPIFIRTHKWGDYYDMVGSSYGKTFFAENPEELIERIKNYKSVPKKIVSTLQEQYFGNPYKNGSSWVVERIELLLKTKN
jgi:hypothetical protein